MGKEGRSVIVAQHFFPCRIQFWNLHADVPLFMMTMMVTSKCDDDEEKATACVGRRPAVIMHDLRAV